MQQYSFNLPYQSPERVFAAFADDPFALFFDSSSKDSPQSRYSFIALNPLETLITRDKTTTIRNGDLELSFTRNPFDMLQSRLNLWKDEITFIKNPGVPFTGGAAGMFGYDLARHLEKLPQPVDAGAATPDMAVGIYTQVIAFDLRARKSWFFAISNSEDTADDAYQNIVTQLAIIQPASPHLNWQSPKTHSTYKDDIAAVIEHIHAGDIFQANLSRQFSAPLPQGFSPYAHYLFLRNVNPAPFAAYMNFGDFQISCSSPERFLQVTDGHIETRPIKGTAPDSDDPARLEQNGKDRAENIMIVDLMRNDLSRVCTPESVDVTSLCKVETYAGLHHLVSAVEGTLTPGKTAIDALTACFPGGSITGAPKLRAMEIIAEHEPVRRGPYCGSLGYVGFDGAMDTNIVIRTLVYKDNIARFNTGGGIVAQSNVEDEYRETLIKARKIFESFAAEEEIVPIRRENVA